MPEDGIAGLASELAGRDLDDFFARYVDGTEDQPLAELLATVGAVAEAAGGQECTRSRRGPRTGTTDGDDADSPAARTTFGFDLAAGGEAKVLHVYNGGPAERAGLAAGDALVAIDGLRVNRSRRRVTPASSGTPGMRLRFTRSGATNSSR